jgi:acyl-CoA thioesterase
MITAILAEDGGVTPDALAQRCAETMYATDRASQHLGMTIEEVAPGRATLRMPVTDIMINGHDICHGGYVVLLADSAFAFACNTYNQRTVAQGLDVTFLRAVRLGDMLVAVATERARQGRTGIYDVTVSREGGDVVAEFRGRSRTIDGTLLDVEG